MTRIKVILAVAALLVAMLAASAAPAMADDNDHVFRSDGERFFVNNGNNGDFLFRDGFRTFPFFFNVNNNLDDCLFLPALTICH